MSDENQFPEQLFERADATELEIAQLRQEFNTGDAGIQRALYEFYVSKSINEIRDFLSERRADGYFQGEEPAMSASVTDDAKNADVSTLKKVAEEVSDFFHADSE